MAAPQAADAAPEIDWKSIDYAAVIEQRGRRLEALRADLELLLASKVYYRDNPADFINDWFWTYDPRRQDGLTHLPLLLWPKQRELVEWFKSHLRDRKPGLVEKSRDMGVTNVALGFAIHQWLFFPGSKVSFGSRKESLVDKIGDPDSIFEKARMMLRMLPLEFLPKGFNEETDATFMKLVNRTNGASITGEAGDNIGRGGRSTLYVVDESAYLERPMKIDAALSQNTDVRIDISSANGNANPFFKKRSSGLIDVFTFHWRSDPRKDDAWYEKQKLELDPVIVASEIDIDYNASVEGVCIPAKFVQAAVGLLSNPALPAEFREALRHGSKRACLDVADEGPDANAFVGLEGRAVFHIEQWREGTTTQTTRRAFERCRELGIPSFRYDKIGVGAGVKGESRELSASATGITAVGINSGGVGTKNLPGKFEDTGRAAVDYVLNVRAFMWIAMRNAFVRTFEVVNGIKEHPPEKLIALPTPAECPLVTELIAEISRPKAWLGAAGKWQIESKDEMEGASPNLADGLAMDFAPRISTNPLDHIR